MTSSTPDDALRAAASVEERRDVWLDLSLPAPAAAPAVDDAQRAARLAALRLQQDEVMQALRSLGATELGRVQVVRNALAVSLPASQVQRAAALPGVVRVRPVVHRNRPEGIESPGSAG